MIQTIEDKIKEGLEGLQYEDERTCFSGGVEDTFTLKPGGYPYAVFEIDSIGGSRYDNCHNNRTYTFKLQVFRDFASLTGTEQEKRRIARKQVAKIVDRLILLYDRNEFLDGIVDNSAIVNFKFGTYTKAD